MSTIITIESNQTSQLDVFAAAQNQIRKSLYYCDRLALPKYKSDLWLETLQQVGRSQRILDAKMLFTQFEVATSNEERLSTRVSYPKPRVPGGNRPGEMILFSAHSDCGKSRINSFEDCQCN